MKHVANRKKTVSPLPRKSFTQPKTAKKGSTAAKAGKQTSTKTIKITADSAPIIATRNAEPKAASLKKEITDAIPKLTVSNNKKKSVVGKTAPAAGKRIANRKTEKLTSENAKAKIQKSKPKIAVKKSETVNPNPAEVKPKAGLEKAKFAKAASKVSTTKPTVKAASKPPETEKNQAVKSVTKTLKIARTKLEKTAPINKTGENGEKTATRIAPVKTSAVAVKSEPAQSASKKTNQKTPLIKLESPVSSPAKNRASKKASPTNTDILPPKANEKKLVVPEIKAVEIQAAPVKTVSSKKAEPVKPPTEVAGAPVPKPRKKKVKPLGAAVFRGKKERYDFQVFPIEGELEDAAAIFIISRRVTDKNKRAHHRMVCIGQTDSVLGELKRHRRGKCFKQHKANAISVLREENEQKRLKIEADLKSAHQIPCPHA